MKAKVEQFALEQGLLCDGGTIIVGLSGGADSVSLLHILTSIKEKYNLHIAAAHLNHHIRGDEADRDERFVRTLCDAWGVPLSVSHADIPRLSAERHESVELCARGERYRFFEQLGTEHDALIATAHTATDNAETMLLHMVRGTGLKGLCGIPVRRGRIIRPLLCVTRAEVEAYCTSEGLSFVTDSTNLSDDYARNRLRHQVMPALRQLNPSLEESFCRLSEAAELSERALRDISTEELKSIRVPYGYACDRLLSGDEGLRRYLLRLIADEAGAGCEYRHILLMESMLSVGGAVDLPGGFRADCAGGVLRIFRPARYDAMQPVPLTEYPFKRILTHDALALPDDRALSDCIAADKVDEHTVVRTRQAGDTFRLYRRNCTKTLKKWMNELGIPREQRDRLRVVANGSVVLWLEGVGASADGMPDRNTTDKAIQITGERYDDE